MRNSRTATVIPRHKLDMLRAAAVMAVFVSHLARALHFASRATGWMGWGVRNVKPRLPAWIWALLIAAGMVLPSDGWNLGIRWLDSAIMRQYSAQRFHW